ncbi:type I pullulanase, partial [Clostridium tertium]|uniref:type I pullulanase n=1 Tax=Clostridium tertium TaxID=1559 RepID=UPI0034A3429B
MIGIKYNRKILGVEGMISYSDNMTYNDISNNNSIKIYNINSLEIKASSNVFHLDEEIQLVALKESIFGIKEIRNVYWEIDYTGKEITLSNNIIKISKLLRKKNSLKVTCVDKITGERACREFSIILNEVEGTLIHFIKNDGDYFGNGYKWDLWSFSNYGVSYAVELQNKSDFGRCTFVREENIIARRKAWGDNWGNDWSEQTATFEIPKGVKNCYIVHGENNLITNLEDVIEYMKPRIEIAIMDKKDSITAFLSKTPLDGTKFYIYINGIKEEHCEYEINKLSKKVDFKNLNVKVSPSDLVEIRASNTFLPCKVTMRNFLDSYYYDGPDMGVVYDKENIYLRIWAPTAFKIDLCLYENWYDINGNEKRVYQMKREEKSGTHYTKISRKKNECVFYLYKLYFKDIDRNGLEYIKINYAVDPYAVSVGVNGEKGFLIDINNVKSMPFGWLCDERPQLLRKEDSIIYEIHVRDFTISDDSGIDKNIRGKYLGLAEEGTTYKDKKRKITVKTGIDHLKELGITHIHLLPVFDFGSVDERKSNKKGNRNWGYDPKNYNAPEGSYSSDPYDPISRIIELREMIKILHKNGIRVVMDVVYNHMQETRSLDNIVPAYYFRTDYRGRFTNGSGCGNEIATERPMVRRFIIDSIKHWLKDYNIDGLRFDLMELIDIDTMKEIVKVSKEIDDSILIYGEPWKGGESVLSNGTYKGSQRGEEFSIFNDTFRDFIRGNNSPSYGFVNGNQHDGATAWSIIEGLKGSINTLTYNPRESINYVDAHDNYTLWDQIEKSLTPGIKEKDYRKIKDENIFDNHLVRRNILALAIILTAQGIPFIQGGAEMLRTKNGDHNSYKSPDNINAIFWRYKAKYIEVFNYIKGLIEIRKNFKAFRLDKREELNNLEISFLNGEENVGVIKWHFKNLNIIEENINDLIVVYNGTSIDDYDINQYMPVSKNGKWNIIADFNKAGVEVIKTVKTSEVPKMKSYSIICLL